MYTRHGVHVYCRPCSTTVNAVEEEGTKRFVVDLRHRNMGFCAEPGAGRASGDKLSKEIITATDRIGSITSHNLFGNLYFDFLNSSRFTPYVGLGVGAGFTDMDYGYLWARNPQPRRDCNGRRAAQQGRDSPEPCRKRRYSCNQAFRRAVRLPGAVRVGLCAHRIGHAGGQGALRSTSIPSAMATSTRLFCAVTRLICAET